MHRQCHFVHLISCSNKMSLTSHFFSCFFLSPVPQAALRGFTLLIHTLHRPCTTCKIAFCSQKEGNHRPSFPCRVPSPALKQSHRTRVEENPQDRCALTSARRQRWQTRRLWRMLWIWDFWAVTSRESTRCCCKARKGPDGRAREMSRGGERVSKERCSPGFSLAAVTCGEDQALPGTTTAAGAHPSSISDQVFNRICSYTAVWHD